MGFYKKGWWKIQPKGSGNAANAFSLMDELFRPTAHEAHIALEEESHKIVKDENSSDNLEIKIRVKKNSASN